VGLDKLPIVSLSLSIGHISCDLFLLLGEISEKSGQLELPRYQGTAQERRYPLERYAMHIKRRETP
jgi:hypothetical protein